MRRGLAPAAAAAALGLAAAGLRAQDGPVPAPAPVPAAAEALSPLEALDRAGRALVERCAPAVVRVETSRPLRLRVLVADENERRSLEERLRTFGPRESVEASGFLVDGEGLVLTTAAAAAGATSIRVVFAGGTAREGTFIGQDPLAGVALVRIEPVEGVRPLALSARDPAAGGLSLFLAREGEGSPELHFGFVASARRAFGPYDAYVVAGAPVLPGQAGAPLLDARGEVMGMAVAPHVPVTLGAAFDASGLPGVAGAAGVAGGAGGEGGGQTLRGVLDRSAAPTRLAAPFASFIPAGELKRIVAELRERGRVRRGLLGIRMDRGEPVAREVPEGFPAAAAGVAPGDRVLAVDGVPVSTSEELTGFVQRRAPGTAVRIRLRTSGGAEREVPVVLAELPDLQPRRHLFEGCGVAAAPSYDTSAARFSTVGVEGGAYVVVASVREGSAAARAGLRPGDWIVEVDGTPLLSEEDYARVATGPAASAAAVEILVYRAGEAQRRKLILK